MPGSSGRQISDVAVELLMELPNAPAMQILDRALEAHRGTDPDFESFDAYSIVHPAYSCALDPPSPFAELIRRAFAPQLDPRELALLALRDTVNDPILARRIDRMTDEWQSVVDLFAARYGLWT